MYLGSIPDILHDSLKLEYYTPESVIPTFRTPTHSHRILKCIVTIHNEHRQLKA